MPVISCQKGARGATILRNTPAAARIAAGKCEDDHAKAHNRLSQTRHFQDRRGRGGVAAMSETDLAAEIRDLAARRDITDAVQRYMRGVAGSTATAC